MEVFLFAHIRALPDRSEEVASAIRQVQEPTRDEPGCLKYSAFQSLNNANEFFIHSHWGDMSAFERHVELPHTIQFAQALEPLLELPLSVTLTHAIA